MIRKYSPIKKQENQNDKNVKDNGDSKEIPKLFIFSSLTRIIIFTIILVMILLSTAWIAIKQFQEEEIEISIPDVVDRNIVQAVEMLQNRNLQAYIIAVKDDTKPINIILKQWPLHGSLVKEKRVVQIWLNTRNALKEVPDFKGKKIDDSLNLLEKEAKSKTGYLLPGRIDFVFNDDVPQNIIISQEPEALSKVSDFTPVNLLVSKGKNVRGMLMKNFTGEYYEYAVKYLESNNINVILKCVKTNDPNMTAKIISQNIDEGIALQSGSVVELEVASLSDDDVPIPIRCVSFTMPLNPPKELLNKDKHYNLTLEVENDDDNDKIIVYQGKIKASQKIAECYQVAGSVTENVYINDNKVYSRKVK